MLSSNSPNIVISKAVHHGRLFRTVRATQLAAGWTPMEEISETLQSNSDTTVVEGYSEPLFANSNNQVILMMYYDQPTTLDKVCLAGVTQTSGINFLVFADDVSIGTVPSTPIAQQAQSVDDVGDGKANTLITFSETTKTAFMVLIDGVAGDDIGSEYEWVENGTFDQDLSSWSASSGAANSIWSNGKLSIIDSSNAEGFYRFQRVDNLQSAVTYKLRYSATGIGVGVGIVRVGTALADGSYLNSNANTDGDYEGTFVLPANVTQCYVSLGNFASHVKFDNISIKIDDSTPLYRPATFSIDSVFFGNSAFIPGRGYAFGAHNSGTSTLGFKATEQRSFGFRNNRLRQEVFPLDQITSDELRALRDLMHEIGPDITLVQRGGDAVDPRDWILGFV